MKIYLICSVRNADSASKKEADAYVVQLESKGHTVHYPPRDVDQTDDGIGFNICNTHRKAIIECDEVHVLWNKESIGSHFDFGMAFALNKKIVVANGIERSKNKSYGNVLLFMSNSINT